MSQDPIKSDSALRTVFSFPHPVNEYAARCVATMVFVLGFLIIVTDIQWLLFLLAYGFIARVLTGPTLSPMGQLATKIIVPIFIKKTRSVAGPPKQFAQLIGLIFSVTALILTYGFNLFDIAQIVLAILVLFAGLEAFLGFCAGCFAFGWLMRCGIVPPAVCDKCFEANFKIPFSNSSSK